MIDPKFKIIFASMMIWKQIDVNFQVNYINIAATFVLGGKW